MNSKPESYFLLTKAVLRVVSASPDTCWQCRILLALAERKLGRRLGIDEELETWGARDNLQKITGLRVREGSKLSTGDEEENRLVNISSLESEYCPR